MTDRTVSPLLEFRNARISFMLRVGEALDRITHVNEGQSIVVVSHGGVIEGSFAYFMGLPTLAAPRIDFFPHNTSITHWQRLLPQLEPGSEEARSLKASIAELQTMVPKVK